jgi:hypothetical protein
VVTIPRPPSTVTKLSFASLALTYFTFFMFVVIFEKESWCYWCQEGNEKTNISAVFVQNVNKLFHAIRTTVSTVNVMGGHCV